MAPQFTNKNARECLTNLNEVKEALEKCGIKADIVCDEDSKTITLYTDAVNMWSGETETFIIGASHITGYDPEAYIESESARMESVRKLHCRKKMNS